MLYASSPQHSQITATPGAQGTCPLCGADLVPKCGRVNVWHWAHKASSDCDPWSEPETPWHLGWKQLVEPAFCEFRLPPHRADMLGNGATVIELQHSPISPDVIEEREAFYDNMIWLFDGTELGERFQWERRFDYLVPWYSNLWYVDFQWKHPRRSLKACKKPIFLDIGNRLIVEVETFHAESEDHFDDEHCLWYHIPAGDGSGVLYTYAAFIHRYLSQVQKPQP